MRNIYEYDEHKNQSQCEIEQKIANYQLHRPMRTDRISILNYDPYNHLLIEQLFKHI